MKLKKLILLLLVPFLLCSCGKYSLKNAEELPFTYKYAEADGNGNQKKITKTYTVTQACDFTNKYVSLLFNRGYANITGKEEEILYSSGFKRDDGYFDAVKEYYEKTNASTSLSNLNINHVIMIDGDAYVNVTADVILKECESELSAKAIGFPDGVGTTNTAELNLKLKFEGNEYKIYDVDWVEKDGFLLSYESYSGSAVYNQDESEITDALTLTCEVSNEGSIRENTSADLTDTARIGDLKFFINNLAAKQNNRDYKTFKGNEDYPLLSDEYISELNAERDDVSYTKKIYSDLQLSTQFINADIKNIEIRKDGYIVTVDITSKITSCISNDRAIAIGYTGGIGSEGVMSFVYTVKDINGTFKLVKSIQTR